MRRNVVLFLLVWMLLLCGKGNAVDNGLVFPVFQEDYEKLGYSVSSWRHVEGSGAHDLNVWAPESDIAKHFKGHRFSDIYALDLNLDDDHDNGLRVRPIASGVVEWIQPDYGFVVIKHATKKIITASDFVNQYVEGKEWYSGYMHMKNISVSTGQFVNIGTELGEIYNTHCEHVHLHFAVYDKDMYSFSPWLLGGVFQDIEYRYAPANKYTDLETKAGHRYSDYRNGEPINPSDIPTIVGTYTAVGGHNTSTRAGTSGALVEGELRIVGTSRGVTRDMLALSGTSNFQNGARLNLPGRDIVFLKAGKMGTDLSTWVTKDPYFVDAFGGEPTRVTANHILDQIDANTLKLTISEKFADIEVTFKKTSNTASVGVSSSDGEADAWRGPNGIDSFSGAIETDAPSSDPK